MKKAKEEVINEEASKPNRHALREDLEGAKESEGAAVRVQKKKSKSVGVVVTKHSRVITKALNGESSKKNLGKSRRKSVYEAMIEEGYSESYARSGQIKDTKSWTRLSGDRLHDDKLTNIHSQLLVAKKLDYMLFAQEILDKDIYELVNDVGCVVKKIVHGVAGTHVWFWSPDSKSRLDALGKAYQVRGKYAPEKFEIERAGLENMTDEDLAALISKQKKKFNKKD